MKKRLLERGLSLLLAFVMVLALAPVFTIEAKAAGTTVGSLGALESALRNYSEITLSSDIAITKDLTIPSGVTVIVPNNRKLVVPYDENQTTVNGANAIDASTPAFSYANAGEIASTSNLKHPGNSFAVYTLTMENGAVIEVQSGGVLAVGGEYSSAGGGLSGQTAGRFGEIKMKSGACIDVQSGGVLSSVGYITGDGTVNLASGAKAYEPFIIGDYQGGTNTVALFHGKYSDSVPGQNEIVTENSTMPFNSYSLLNIQTRIELESGANLMGYCDLYTTPRKVIIWTVGGHNKTIVSVIGKQNSIFNLTNGYAVLNYSAPNDYASNKILGQTQVDIYGDCAFGSLKLYIDLAVASFDVSSEKVFFTLPYSFKIVQQCKSLTVPAGIKVKMLPGSGIHIGEEASLVVGEANGKHGVLVVYDGLSSDNNRFYPKAADLLSNGYSQRACLLVDGTLSVNGSFGGKIETTGKGYVVVGANAKLSATSYEGVEAGWGISAMGHSFTVSTTNRTQHTQTAQIVMHANKYGTADKLVEIQKGQTYYGVSAEQVQKDTFYSYTFDPSSAKTPKTGNYSGAVSLQGTWSTTPVVFDNGADTVSAELPSTPADASVIYYTDSSFTTTTNPPSSDFKGVAYYRFCSHETWENDVCTGCKMPRYSVNGETVTYYHDAINAIAAAYDGDKMVVCDVQTDGVDTFTLTGLKSDMTVKIFLLDADYAPIAGYVPEAKTVN